jgi:sugar lactone lactonase YvrE
VPASPTLTAELLSNDRSILGESPVWCDRRQQLFYVDSRAPAFRAYDPSTGKMASHPLPETTGSICLTQADDFLVAMTSGVYRLTEGGTLGSRLAAPETEKPDNRFNDGRCDRAGRFIVGTMNDRQRVPTGSLWQLSGDHDCRLLADDIIVPNSIAFSPDDKRMYFADTYRHVIHVFDYDIDTGKIANRRPFSDMNGWKGRPDGSQIDADGCLWNAEYAGGRVVRYTPDGRIDRIVTLPVSQPTSCTFGGRNLDELYITTASQRLSPEQLAAEPLAGALFVVRAGVSGLPEGRYLS